MEPLHKVLVYSETQETKRKLRKIHTSQVEIKTLTRLPSRADILEIDFDLIILEISDSQKLLEQLDRFRSVCVLLVLSAPQMELLSTAKLACVDFVSVDFSGAEVLFRVKKLIESGKQKKQHYAGQTRKKLASQLLLDDKNYLKQELAKLTLALNDSPVSVIITDKNNCITYVNDAFTNLSGYTLEEAKGEVPRYLLRFNNRNPEDQQVLNQALRRGETWNTELKSFRKNGTPFWNSAHIVPILDDKGNLDSRVILMEDLTEQKRTEDTLRKSQKQLKTIFEFSPIGMAFINSTNNIVKANDQLAGILGQKIENIVDSNANAVFSNKDLISTLKKARGGEPATYKGIYNLNKKNSIYIKAIVNPIFPGQSPTDVVAIITDVTDEFKKESTLEKAKNIAESANQAKSSFLANMSHEIRTPMNAVLGFAELLKKSISDPLLAGYTNSIINSGNTLMHIINDVLDMSKIEAGMLSIHNEPVKLKSLLTDLESIFEIRVREKKLLYFSHVDEKLPKFLMLDDLRVRQILLNLVNNAVKFTSKGYIKLLTSATFNKDNTVNVEIKISDTGRGIKEENLEKIFEAFNQQDNTFTKQFGGTGLGLTISRKLAGMLGGELTVISKEGMGSTFTFTIRNVEVCEESNFKSEETGTETIAFDTSSILLVDSNPLNLEILTKLLQPRFKKIRTCSSGAKAVSMCNEEAPDIVLMDRRTDQDLGQMPAKTIKKNLGEKGIPIIALTASIFLDKQKDIEALGFDDFIRRPVNEKELLILLMRYLGQKATRQTETIPELKLKISDKVKLEQIKTHVATRLLPAIQQLNQNQSMRAVNSLANTLIQTDQLYGIEAFKPYGKSLQLLSLNFDVAEIRNKLAELNMQFTNFVEESFETSLDK